MVFRGGTNTVCSRGRAVYSFCYCQAKSHHFWQTEVTLNYYTLTLNPGEGIDSVQGAGVYLEGTRVSIGAVIKDGFDFVNWTGKETISDVAAEVVMNGTVQLTANGKKQQEDPAIPPQENPGSKPAGKLENNPDKKIAAPKQPKTSDENAVAMYAPLCMLSAAAVIFAKKRR